MSTTQNGWPKLYDPPSTYFTAPNGKRVYCASSDVATIFEYVAQQWHDRIEKLPAATNNIGDPAVRMGYIVIHAYRPPGATVGIADRSNHRSATGMDILGDRHHYAPSCRAGKCGYPRGPHTYRSGFTAAQMATLRQIQQEVGKNSRGRYILRMGAYDFDPAYFDAMHVECAPGVTAQDVKAAAARLRATEVVIDLTHVHRALAALNYNTTPAGVRAYQHDRGLTVDGIPGPITTAALEADMATLKDIAAEQKRQRKQLDTIEAVARLAANNAKWAGPSRTVGNMVPLINGAVKAIQGDPKALADASATAAANQED